MEGRVRIQLIEPGETVRGQFGDQPGPTMPEDRHEAAAIRRERTGRIKEDGSEVFGEWLREYEFRAAPTWNITTAWLLVDKEDVPALGIERVFSIHSVVRVPNRKTLVRVVSR